MFLAHVISTPPPLSTQPLCTPSHIDSHACEAGVDHVELESALWASVTACVKALEHTAKGVDYQTLCEGLARLSRIIRSLLHRAACSAGQSQQSERQVSSPLGVEMRREREERSAPFSDRMFGQTAFSSRMLVRAIFRAVYLVPHPSFCTSPSHAHVADRLTPLFAL